MGTRRNIVLVGFMGTGKTSVGRRLALRLGMTFVDMDDVIREREGRPIPRIFAENGEPYFRSLERALVGELSRQTGLVVSTGGGIVLNPENVRDYASSGLVVCLSAAPEAILQRVAGDTNRPLLAGDDKMKKILPLLETRRPLYAAIPHQVDTTRLSVEQVVERVLELYRGADDQPPAS
jgi:shikimate kinase